MAHDTAAIPPGAARAFNQSKTASSQKKIIIERFLNLKRQRGLEALHQVERLFAQSDNVVFPDRIFGQWISLLNIFEVCEPYFEPEIVKTQATGISNYGDTVADIKKTAQKLAALLRRAEVERQTHGIDANHSLSLDELIFDAVENKPNQKDNFDSYIKPTLETLSRFDDRYWPTVAELVDEIGAQFSTPNVTAYPLPPTQAHQKNGFLKIFFEAISRAIGHRQIGMEILQLTAEDWSWIFNTASGREIFYNYDINNFKANKPLFRKK